MEPSGSHPQTVAVHGGDTSAVARALGIVPVPPLRMDFSVNINPLGPPPGIVQRIAAGAGTLTAYPDAIARAPAEALAAAHKVPADNVLVGNGSTEIFFWMAHTLATSAGWMAPTYSGYGEACIAAAVPAGPLAVRPPSLPYDQALQTIRPAPGSLLFLGSPDNPTGQLLSADVVRSFTQAHPACWVALDESFLDFVPDAADRTLIRPDMPHNLVVVKSLTKFFAIPGLRLGMACAHPDTCRRIARARLPWSVNALAQTVAPLLYADPAYLSHSRRENQSLREQLDAGLRALGWTVFPSAANFLLACPPVPWTATLLQAELLRRGILIRSCRDFEGLGDSYVRLAVRPEPEIRDFLATLKELSAPAAPVQPRAASCVPKTIVRKTPAIMVVGTASHAGKTVLAAALCRHFQRQGVHVAPFKAQNMALNSFVTPEGGEIGRAQAMQACAARIPAHTDMNPVLLKPTDGRSSQIIVNGRSIGVMNARSYYTHKQSMREAARAAYDRLAARHSLVILEGAGSPSEINLIEEDFVNMAMAEYAQARVLLVADIDRGGVFAAIHGTLALLPPRFRKLVSGVVINKFRGDPSLLEPGIREIQVRTGVPVLGVLPFDETLRLDEEDSVGLEGRPSRAAALLDIAVIRLEHISNYTDFLPLEQEPAVSVRYPQGPGELGNPDLIVLPGTKNTRGDLLHLRESGLAAALLAAAGRRIPILGICGGYQMLGKTIADPDGVEGPPGESEGLGLLDIATTLESAKELAQVTGSTLHPLPFARPGTRLCGYEIHAGRTSPAATPAIAITFRRGTPVLETDGAVSPDGRVCGCYMHGLFDEPEFRAQFVRWLLNRKGLPGGSAPCQEPPDPYDALADLVDRHMDMTTVDAWSGQEPGQ